jgi:GGDEF domain-containing protein
LSGDDDAAALADRLLECFDEPFALEAGDVRIGSSVGVALHAGGVVEAEQLLRTADADMYRDKHVRRARRASDRGGGVPELPALGRRMTLDPAS